MRWNTALGGMAGGSSHHGKWLTAVTKTDGTLGLDHQAKETLRTKVTFTRKQIGERLARQDPNNAQWQTDVVVSYWKLAQSNTRTARVACLRGRA